MEFINDFMSEIPVTLLFALVGAMALDWVTGILRSLYIGETNSKDNYKGIIKKLGIIISVMLGAITDLIVSDGTPLFTTLILLFATAGEGLSIIENLGVMGVHIPKPLADRLTQIREENDRKMNEDEDIDCESICPQDTNPDTTDKVLDKDVDESDSKGK